MAQPPPAKHLPLLIAASLGALVLAGVGLITADEHMGTAHLSQIEAPEAEPATTLATKAPEVPEPEAGASFAAAKPAPSPAQGHAAEKPLLTIRRTLTIKEPIKYGQWFWDETNAPATGPLIITVDLKARVLSVFRDGVEIGTTAVLLGTQEKPTPTGIFPITQKDAHHVSNLYDAPMPYMMRLTNDGVTIHATHVQNGYASHGCVGVPMDFAKKVFAIAHLGDKVIITNAGKIAA